MVTLVLWGVVGLILLLLFVTAKSAKEEDIKTISRHEYPNNRTWPPSPNDRAPL